jgi:hypothetical protein
MTAQQIFDKLESRGFSVRLVAETIIQIYHDGLVSNIKYTDDFGIKRWVCNVVYINNILLTIQD